MRISVSKVSAVVAVAAVAALGAQYASAAPSPGAKGANPNVAPIRNIATMYSTTSTGGTGDVDYTLSPVAPGVYQASFAANFFPEGTPSAPETFGCSLIKNGSIMRAQSTVSTGYSSGFYAGVSATNTVKMNAGDHFDLFCGTADGTAWTWGTLPAQVTFTRLDGLAGGTISPSKHKTGSMSVAGTR